MEKKYQSLSKIVWKYTLFAWHGLFALSSDRAIHGYINVHRVTLHGEHMPIKWQYMENAFFFDFPNISESPTCLSNVICSKSARESFIPPLPLTVVHVGEILQMIDYM